MNIASLVPSAVVPASLPALAAVNPSAAPVDILAPPAVAGNAATIVDLSKLGQLLSASTLLQPQPVLAGAVERVAEQDASANLDNGFGKLLAAAHLFVDAYNQFQSADVSNVQDPLIVPLDNVLLLAINELPASGTGKSLLASLAQVGIAVQDAASTVGSAPLAIDAAALESAFNANPAATSALLAQSFQSIGQIAAKFAGQNVNFFGAGPDLAPPASPFDVLPVALPPIAADSVAATLPGPLPSPLPGPLPGPLADQAPADVPASNSAPAAPAVAAAAPGLAQPASAPAANVFAAPIVATDTVNTVAAQRALADRVANNNLATNPAAPPIASALNAPTAPANSVLPARVSDVITVATPAASLETADAALQRSLTDQALRNALDVNSIATAAAPTLDTVAPANAPPTAAATQAGVDLGVADQAADPIAGTATAGVTTSDIASNSLVPAQVQVPAPLAALDDGRAPMALDPSVAAAIAAYRLGSGAVAGDKIAQPLPEANTDVSAVGKTRPLAFDPNDGSSDARRNEAARNAALALAENKALATTQAAPPNTVDVTI